MATSLYSASLRFALPTTGDLFGTWGTEINNSITNMVDQAIAGRAVVSMSSDANYTLTALNGTSDEARCAVLRITSGVSLTATRNIVVPLAPKLWIVENATTGGQSIQVIAASGTGVTIPNGRTYRVRCDGTNVVLADGDSVNGVGTAVLPSYTFSGHTGTGFWVPGSSILAASLAGVEAQRWVTTQSLFTGVTDATLRAFATSGFAATQLDASGSNATYHFFKSGGTETARIVVNNVGAMTFNNTASVTEAMRITQAQFVLVGTSTANTSGAKLQTSNGITFPATAVASADANTLDDYEEGTWTPTAVGASVAGTGTYAIQLGYYTKIGRLVQVRGYVSWTAHTGSGDLRLGGFPFGMSSDPGDTGYSAGVSLGGSLTYAAGSVPLIASLGGGGTQAALSATASGAGANVALVANGVVAFNLTYAATA
jgi:hypothetical protein